MFNSAERRAIEAGRGRHKPRPDWFDYQDEVLTLCLIDGITHEEFYRALLVLQPWDEHLREIMKAEETHPELYGDFDDVLGYV